MTASLSVPVICSALQHAYHAPPSRTWCSKLFRQERWISGVDKKELTGRKNAVGMFSPGYRPNTWLLIEGWLTDRTVSSCFAFILHRISDIYEAIEDFYFCYGDRWRGIEPMCTWSFNGKELRILSRWENFLTENAFASSMQHIHTRRPLCDVYASRFFVYNWPPSYARVSSWCGYCRYHVVFLDHTVPFSRSTVLDLLSGKAAILAECCCSAMVPGKPKRFFFASLFIYHSPFNVANILGSTLHSYTMEYSRSTTTRSRARRPCGHHVRGAFRLCKVPLNR